MNALTTGRRSLRLIEILAESPHERTFSELAEGMSLSGASLSRLLKMLADEKWVRQRRSNGRYTLGYRAQRLGHSMRGFGLQSAHVQGIVASLAYTIGHSACVATYQGDCFTIVAKTEIQNCYHFIDVFAPNTDWIDNGMGQYLLAYQPSDAVQRIYRDHFGFPVPDAHRQGFETIRSQRQLVRREGAITRFVAGIGNPDSGNVASVVSVAALNVHPSNEKEIMELTKKAAVEASTRLTGRPTVPAKFEEA